MAVVFILYLLPTEGGAIAYNVNIHVLVQIYLLYIPTLVHIHSNFDSIHAPYISTKSFNYHLIPKLSIGLTILIIAVLVTCVYISVVFESL